ncbi:MAG: AAA family ATPase, partial [Syntrophales bacterium]|nr:AAA family ATPase [Syntrophales bacterium]
MGKTYLVRTLAAFLKVPVAFTSANEYSETGYVGRSVGDMVEELYKKAGENRKKAEQGIIFIDEFDKLAERGSDFDHNTNRDVSGRSVQEELLDLLESDGSRTVSFGKHLNQEMEFDTSRILFIAAGAFNGLDRIVKKNRHQKTGIGFVSAKTSSASLENAGSSIESTDLESYGLIPELLGRFPVICSLAPLSEDNLTHIMVEPKDSILEEFQGYFRSFGVEVEFKEGALKKIAHIAAERGTGARGLRSVLEAVLQPYLFKLEDNNGGQPGKRIII